MIPSRFEFFLFLFLFGVVTIGAGVTAGLLFNWVAGL